MLKQLDFEVSFASTGKELKGKHTFNPGMTAITGENEKGKSMRIEMIRYALWGTKALRAKNMNSYKKLKAKLLFSVGGNDYEVERGSKTVLKRGEDVLANGVTPVNEAIIRIFGYDMDVFDSANAVLQGEVNAMTNKTPAERKRMVDKTIGLDSLDDLIKKYTNDLANNKKIFEALERQQVEEPVLNMPPLGYKPSADVQKELDEADALLVRHNTLIGQLAYAKPKAPRLSRPEIRLEMVSMNDLLEQRMKRNGVIRDLDRAKAQYNAVKWIKPDLKQLAIYKDYIDTNQAKVWEDFNAYQSKLIDVEMYAQFDLEKLEQAKDALISKPLMAELKKLYDSPQVTCPECSHTFFLDNDVVVARIEEIKEALPMDDYNQIEELIGYLLENKIPPAMRMIEGAIEGAKDYRDLTGHTKPQEPTSDNLGSVELVQSKIALIELQQTTYAGKEKMEAEIKELEDKLATLSDPAAAIDLKEREMLAYDNWTKLEAEHMKYETLRSELEPELASLAGIEERRADIHNRLSEARIHEIHINNYEFSLEQFTKFKTEMDVVQQEITILTNIRKGLNDIKPKVKSYLIPSLSRVASGLLSQMTNGVRTRIEISDDFDIKVDGTDVDTLSGSGKSVANLAVRLGLGTVLTNKIFSVLMVDEIDAFMDKNRGEYVAECLDNLTKVFGQIINISHKSVKADHYIEL